ncbi:MULTISPECIES: hypothetical protein [unclassified Microbacterium]|uniref:hypothetical protein n=1 Tax=unclassified Microbacterium TaxID=2609290 RepID=UPI00257E18D3|nr:hypothetical protein [Microbacterium sp.]
MTTIRDRRTAGALRRTLTCGILLALAGTALAACAADSADPATGAPSAEAPSPTPTPTPLTPAEQLLADNAATPGVCAVSFTLDGATLDPQLQIQDRLYDHLPIPRADGRAFAGWYPDAGAAAAASADPATGAGNPATRVNGSNLVACTDQQVTLYGAWTTPDAVTAAKARIPILMYHQFTDKPEGESGWLRGNYSYIEDYRASMQYIKDQAFYLPTWDELSAFIDGALYLPDHSVIITDDDADPTWLTMASPINEQLQVMATSFDITGDGAVPQNRFILPRSHTNNMHTAQHAHRRRQRQRPDGQPHPRGDRRRHDRLRRGAARHRRHRRRDRDHGLPVRALRRPLQAGPHDGRVRDGADDRAGLCLGRLRQARAAVRAHQLRHGRGRSEGPHRVSRGTRRGRGERQVTPACRITN